MDVFFSDHFRLCSYYNSAIKVSLRCKENINQYTYLATCPSEKTINNISLINPILQISNMQLLKLITVTLLLLTCRSLTMSNKKQHDHIQINSWVKKDTKYCKNIFKENWICYHNAIYNKVINNFFILKVISANNNSFSRLEF